MKNLFLAVLFLSPFALAQDTLLIDNYRYGARLCNSDGYHLTYASPIIDGTVTFEANDTEGFCFTDYTQGYGSMDSVYADMVRTYTFNTATDLSAYATVEIPMLGYFRNSGWSFFFQDAFGNYEERPINLATPTTTIALDHAVDFTAVTALGIRYSGGVESNVFMGPIVLTGSADADGDGVDDETDTCPESAVAATVILNGCDTGVTNYVDSFGCTVADKIADCGEGVSKPYQFVTCLKSLTQNLVDDGLLTSAERTAILGCGWEWGKPNPQDDIYTTDWSTVLDVAAPGVLANDEDPQDDALEAHLVTPPADGSLSLHRDGSFSYTPIAGIEGPQQFVYRAWDGSSYREATVTIQVGQGNLAPIAGDDFASVAMDTRLSVAAPGVLANDYDPEGQPLTVYLYSTTSNGHLGFHADGSFWYEPNPGFNGLDSFVYKLDDGDRFSTATVTIQVGP